MVDKSEISYFNIRAVDKDKMDSILEEETEEVLELQEEAQRAKNDAQDFKDIIHRREILFKILGGSFKFNNNFNSWNLFGL